MTDQPTRPPMDALWPDDLARLLGVKRSSVNHYAQQAAAAARAREADPSLPPPGPGDFPVPDGRALRKVEAAGAVSGAAYVMTPWWSRATVEAWLPNRRRRGSQAKTTAR